MKPSEFNLILTPDSIAFDEYPQLEIARVLRVVAAMLESSHPFESGWNHNIKDINGNTVGIAVYTQFTELESDDIKVDSRDAGREVSQEKVFVVYDCEEPSRKFATRGLSDVDPNRKQGPAHGGGSTHRDLGTAPVQEEVREIPQREEGKQGMGWVPRSESK